MSQLNVNNNDTMQSNMPQPTMMDLFQLLTKCAQKEDMEEIKASIITANQQTATKIEEINHRLEATEADNACNTNRIQSLEISLEIMKQEQLKNNMCISGVPPKLISKDNNTADLVLAIAKKLGADCNVSQFSSYAVAGNKFIIVRFYNMKHKQQLMNKIRTKKSLMVEEVFKEKSNSQIYLNDHLTPYFNALFFASTYSEERKETGIGFIIRR